MKIYLLALLLVLVARPALATCDDLIEDMLFGSGLTTWVENVAPELLSGKQTPKWQDFDDLEQVIQRVKQKANALDAEQLGELEKTLNELKPQLLRTNELKKLAVVHNTEGANAAEYRPTDYELRTLYQNMIKNLNAALPGNLKIPVRKLPKSPRSDAQLRIEGERIVKKLEQDIARQFSTTGFASEEEYVNALLESPAGKNIYEVLRDEKVELSMRRPQSARWWVPKVGFQNQRITGTSRGTNDNAYRDQAEAKFTAGIVKNFPKIDNDLKPKYGYLRPIQASERGRVPNQGVARQYGEDHYVFKKEKVRDRLTWTNGDSLGMRKEEITSWDHRMVPWRYRSLLAPAVMENYYRQLSSFVPLQASQKLSKTFIEKFQHANSRDRYTELQFWGPISLDDVELFEFSQNPPEGEFLQELLRRGIKIRDGRQWPVKEWTPGDS
ncbi:MAG: hypothetical protein JST16_09715 [Bdellovibrionales bacterium]|nr:hypothetical protein [Bdellovibrionales bacterium]